MYQALYKFAALTVALAVTAGAVTAQQKKALTRDLSVEQTELAELTPPKSTLEVSAWVDRTDDTYREGDTMQIFVKPNQDAYITIVDVGTSGKVHILFPNKFQRDNRVLAHQVLQIPGDDTWRIKVGGPAGQELIKVIATIKPDPVINLARLDELGPFYRYREPAPTLTRDLSAVINREHHGSSATAEKVVRILQKTSGLAPQSLPPNAVTSGATQTASLPVPLRPATPPQPAAPTPATATKAAPAQPAAPSQPKAQASAVVAPEDLFKLGEAHFYGDAGRSNHREALKYLTAAADAGHVGAMFFIGRIHEAGQDVDADAGRAVTWYRRAADLGNTQAMVRLALLHASKDGPHRDVAESVRWLKKAAAQGDGMAMIHVARMHDEGLGVDKSAREAARYLLAALKTGAWTVIDQVSKFSEDTRREVQAQLQAAGHYRGPVEGRVGAETRAAMVEWARAG